MELGDPDLIVLIGMDMLEGRRNLPVDAMVETNLTFSDASYLKSGKYSKFINPILHDMKELNSCPLPSRIGLNILSLII